MTKISTVGTRQTRNFAEQQLTIGLDLGDRSGVISIRDFPFAHRSDSLASSESQNTPSGVWQDFFRTIKVLALSFLLLIGISLVGEGLGLHIPKGYIYFAMGFPVFVEAIEPARPESRFSYSPARALRLSADWRNQDLWQASTSLPRQTLGCCSPPHFRLELYSATQTARIWNYCPVPISCIGKTSLDG
jgi:hypothetical protein